MTFIEVEKIDAFTETVTKHIQIDNGDGSFKSFPVENSNPEFISFLRELEKTNDPYFLAWVEAGNDPDEFWTQTSV